MILVFFHSPSYSLDIHHGNGTEQILKKYNHPEKILFWSSHIYFNVSFSFITIIIRTLIMNMSFIQEQANPIILVITFTINLFNLFGKLSSISIFYYSIHSNRRHDSEGGRVLFRKAVTTRLLPLLRSFSPDLIIMSSGSFLILFFI